MHNHCNYNFESVHDDLQPKYDLRFEPDSGLNIPVVYECLKACSGLKNNLTGVTRICVNVSSRYSLKKVWDFNQ